jgi:hypothetical protein
MSEALVSEAAIAYALVDLKTGLVLDGFGHAVADPLVEFAAASPEIFAAAKATDWPALFARFGSEGSSEFREFVLVSPTHVRVMQRLPERPQVALVAVASGAQNLGFVLSDVRRKLLQLKEE